MESSQSFPADVTSPGAARRFVASALGGTDDARCQVALVLTSELVTNAVIHARTTVDVRVEVEGDRMRVEVADGDRHLPEPADYAPDALGGRGLFLVSELASDWGADLRPGGKIIWFCLDTERAAGVRAPAEGRYAPRGVHG